jgi:hypothetical protein
LKYREYLQAYSLEKTGKQISCCNYYVYSKILGDYLHFYAGTALKIINQEEFNKLLNLNQIMITKKFLFENLQIIKGIFQGKKINFITKENTAFVSFPLIRIKKFNLCSNETTQKVFDFKFLFKLFSLKYQKDFFIVPYLFALFLEILKGKTFILKEILEKLSDKDKQVKMKSFD